MCMEGVKHSDQIERAYLHWMMKLVCEDGYGGNVSWHCLFRLLHEIEFTYILSMDENRAVDGCDLRYRFAYECGYDLREIKDAMADKPCSVLEMMVALAKRCEDHIMDDPENENRTGEWFFEMIDNLGLIDMFDDRFDAVYVRAVISRFLRREYSDNGYGGLFTLRYHHVNMKKIEIWYQAMWYLDEVIHGERM